MNSRTWIVVILAVILHSPSLLADPCGSSSVLVLSELITSGGCTLDKMTFSSFSFIKIAGNDPVGAANIAVNPSLRSGLPGLNFNSTPLVFAPSGSGTVEIEIGFTATIAEGSVTGIDVIPGTGSTADTARSPVVSFACLGGTALVATDGSVSCSTGHLLSFDATFNTTSAMSFGGVSTVGIVNDVSVQATDTSFGELTNVLDQFQTTATPEPSTGRLLLLALVATCALILAKLVRHIFRDS